jgi:hypothetical protein
MSHASAFEVVAVIPKDDFKVTCAQRRGGGTATVDGVTLHFVTDLPNLYLWGTRQSWLRATGSAPDSQRLADRWWRVSSSVPAFSGWTEVSTAPTFAAGVLAKIMRPPTLAGSAVIDGQTATVLSMLGGNEDVGIASQGRPWILSIRVGRTMSLTFSHFDTAPLPRAPKHAAPLPARL